jgi:predicted GIY-YIG superfamily endonuclease
MDLPIKDNLGLRTPGVYSIPCECGRAYISQTDRSIKTRLKQHKQNMAERSFKATSRHCKSLSQVWIFETFNYRSQ